MKPSRCRCYGYSVAHNVMMCPNYRDGALITVTRIKGHPHSMAHGVHVTHVLLTKLNEST